MAALIEQTTARGAAGSLQIAESTVWMHLHRAREASGFHHLTQLIWWMTEYEVFGKHGLAIQVTASDAAELSPDDLRRVASVIRHGTYDRAARELGVTRAAVFQRMKRLWTKLGLCGEYQVIWWATHHREFRRQGIPVTAVRDTAHVIHDGEGGSAGILEPSEPEGTMVAAPPPDTSNPASDGSGCASGALRMLPLGRLVPNPEQARKRFDAKRLARLTSSVSDLGVLEPLIVRPAGDGRYEIVAGERRYRAAVEAGLTEVPCLVRECGDLDGRKLNLVENLQREDLSDIDKSDALCAYRKETGRTWKEVAGDVGLTSERIRHVAMLQRLPEAAKTAIRAGRISGRVAQALLSVPETGREEVLERAIRERLTAEDVRALAGEYSGRTECAPRSTRGAARTADRLLRSAQAMDSALSSLLPERRRELFSALAPLMAKLSDDSGAGSAEA